MFLITKLREEKNWSKLELSRRSGVPYSEIVRMEGGKIYPYPGWRKKLGEALGVDPEILFQEVQENEKECA